MYIEYEFFVFNYKNIKYFSSIIEEKLKDTGINYCIYEKSDDTAKFYDQEGYFYALIINLKTHEDYNIFIMNYDNFASFNILCDDEYIKKYF